MKIFSSRFTSALLLIIFTTAFTHAQTELFPDSGAVAVAQRCRDIRGNMSVLNISMRPGQEDLTTLAYLRLSRGARLLGVYVTNGETEPSDQSDPFPYEIAVTRRQEATSALAALESEVLFMNFPDIAAATSMDEVQERWSPDSLVARFMRIISQSKPDLILISTGAESGNTWTDEALSTGVLTAVQSLATRGGDRKKMKQYAVAAWDVGRVAMLSRMKTGLKIPAATLIPILKKSYESIGAELSSRYVSLSVRKSLHPENDGARYQPIYPAASPKSQELDGGLPTGIPRSLQSLDRKIQAAMKKITDKPSAGKIGLRYLPPLLSDVDRAIVKTADTFSRENRLLLNWKEGLEKLRVALLGVCARYRLNYSILTERQLVEFRIDSVVNIPAGGHTIVMFPMAQRGWIVNETAKTDFPLSTKESYRLVTPEKVEYDLPAARYYQKRATIATPITIILIHRGATSEESFVYRMTARIQYAPRFTAEVITPIVRCLDGEKLVVRLTNHTRDGVSDKLRVADSIAYSNVVRIALSTKEKSEQDTLTLTWYKDLRETSYIVPIEYGGMRVAQFLGRKFAARADVRGSVGVITGVEGSQTLEALRRLGVQYSVLPAGAPLDTAALGSMRVVIIDRRALTLRTLSADDRRIVNEYVTRGGRLLILAQDPDAWNEHPLLAGVALEASTGQPETMAVRIDTTSALLASPNGITKSDFDGWLIERAANIVKCTDPAVQRPITTESGNPVLVIAREGKGTISYVDLALTPQFMNLHAGAMRLFANLISQ